MATKYLRFVYLAFHVKTVTVIVLYLGVQGICKYVINKSSIIERHF